MIGTRIAGRVKLRAIVADPFSAGQLPSGFPEVASLPATRRLLAEQVDMQFADLRALLRLPQDSVAPHAGCNFTAAAMICAQISGFSVWFFHNRQAQQIARREMEKRRKFPLSGERFEGFVRAYYPRAVGEPELRVIAKRVYQVRNLLAHSLGLDDLASARRGQIVLAKPDPALTASDITDLETQPVYPLAGVPVQRSGLRFELSVPGLYWALGRMLRQAIADQPECCEAYAAEIVDLLPVPTGA